MNGALARTWLDGRSPGLLIGGEFVPPGGHDTFETFDPATGETLAILTEASADDVDAAVAAARAALTAAAWADVTPAARARLLWRVADAIEEHLDELAELETLDQGKTLATSRFAEIPSAAEQFRYYAGWATKITGTAYTPSIGYAPPGRRVTAQTVPEPIGVVAAIVPWNSPLLMAAMKMAPALAAGCTIILKPAEETSLTALRFAELVSSILPPGVVNVLTGGPSVGAALAAHTGVDKITFTGSTEVGKRLVQAASGDLKRLTLELGGKSPAIVLADADLSLTIPGLGRGIFNNSGQVCVAGSRILVQRGAFDEVVDRFAAHAAGLTVGPGLDPSSDLGPLVSTRHAGHVAGFLVEDGLSVVTGGRRGDTAFFEPTVVVGATNDQRIMQEEIFGPVAALTPFDDLDEAVALANDTRYGLAASVWTQDLSAANTLTSRIKAGTVWVNCHSYFSPELVKGGHKESGWGYENGAHGVANYLEHKTICTLY